MSNIIWTDGPNYPDLFDGETPIRTPIDMDSLNLKVYRVNLSYRVTTHEENTRYVVSKDEDEAEDVAWNEIEPDIPGGIQTDTEVDSIKVEEVDFDDELSDGYPSSYVRKDGKLKTGKDLIMEYLEEKTCT